QFPIPSDDILNLTCGKIILTTRPAVVECGRAAQLFPIPISVRASSCVLGKCRAQVLCSVVCCLVTLRQLVQIDILVLRWLRCLIDIAVLRGLRCLPRYFTALKSGTVVSGQHSLACVRFVTSWYCGQYRNYKKGYSELHIMGRRPRAQIIIDPPIPVPSNPTPSACTATDDPPPITGTVPATRRAAQPRLPRSNAPPKKPACPGSPRTSISARVKPSVTRSPSPGLMASTSSSVHVSTHPNAASSMPPTMDWSSWTVQGTTGRKQAPSSRASRLRRHPPSPIAVHAPHDSLLTRAALATEAEQLGIAVQDIRIGRTSSTLRSTDPRLLSKLSALSDVVNARLTLKIVNTPSQSPDPQHRRLPSYSCVLRSVELDVTADDVA
ncbi:hypothetical protein CBL_20891, partial [Carabus blaptoides fortunei]